LSSQAELRYLVGTSSTSFFERFSLGVQHELRSPRGLPTNAALALRAMTTWQAAAPEAPLTRGWRRVGHGRRKAIF
jgi:hypothetical protein